MAEEIDNLSKKLNIVTGNLDFKIEGSQKGVVGSSEALMQDVANNKRDIDKFGVDLA